MFISPVWDSIPNGVVVWYNIYCIVKATDKPADQTGERRAWHEPKELVYLIFNSLKGVSYGHRGKDSPIIMEALDSANGKKLLELAQKEKFEQDNAEIFYESTDFKDFNSGKHDFSITVDSFGKASEIDAYIKNKKNEERLWIAGMYVHVGDFELPPL
jgi:hypothetical protein